MVRIDTGHRSTDPVTRITKYLGRAHYPDRLSHLVLHLDIPVTHVVMKTDDIDPDPENIVCVGNHTELSKMIRISEADWGEESEPDFRKAAWFSLIHIRSGKITPLLRDVNWAITTTRSLGRECNRIGRYGLNGGIQHPAEKAPSLMYPDKHLVEILC